MKSLCVIYNPAARGEKAKILGEHLESLHEECKLCPTQYPGHATELAANAVQQGVECVVAVGGDGTIHEVVNGLMRSGTEALPLLGVIPAGTANVFAVEHQIPCDFDDAWSTILQRKSKLLDVIQCTYSDAETKKEQNAYVLQLAGVGFDAFTLCFVSWKWKKKIGKIAYWLASVQALFHTHPKLICKWDEQSIPCELALIGNGRHYGGKYILFPHAKPDDGLLDITIFPKVNLNTAMRVFIRCLFGKRLYLEERYCFQTQRMSMEGNQCDFELEGERVGVVPTTFIVLPRRLRVIMPNA